jgi:quercetin dioxygenase-like cupin family protein
MNRRVCSEFVRRLALVLVCSAAFVVGSTLTEAEPDQAIALTADASALRWEPCPPLFATGCEIAILQGLPSEANADVFFKVPPSYRIPPHWHTSAERMVLVSGELHVTYHGQATAKLVAGTYAYGPAKAPHKAVCASEVDCVLFIAFESPVDAHPFEGAFE